MLTRFWFTFNLTLRDPHPPGVLMGCGVTALNMEDALGILRERVFANHCFPDIKNTVADVDISKLDEGSLVSYKMSLERRLPWCFCKPTSFPWERVAHLLRSCGASDITDMGTQTHAGVVIPLLLIWTSLSAWGQQTSENVVEVEAESLYEAVAQAVADFREDPLLFSHPSPMTEFTVAVLRNPTEHKIRLLQGREVV